MTIIFNKNNMCFIDHNDFISNIYNSVNNFDGHNAPNIISNYSLNKILFSIKKETKHVKERRKRKVNEELVDEARSIKYMYNNLIDLLPADLKEQIRNKQNVCDSGAVRDLSKKFFESAVFDMRGTDGGNNSCDPLLCKINDDDFLIPAKCRFLSGEVTEQCRKLVGNKYDIIIADPPWWNKYIRRLKTANESMGYSMMYNEEIAAIPLSNLTTKDCIIAVWCTNSPSNITAVKDIIFPQWGVEYLATWYWLKLTVDLEPVCSFGGGSKKQPYERIIIGKVGDIAVPNGVLIASVPSALHSHKPPLLDILSKYTTQKEPKVLELFARYLLPNTTSIGFEPLKWQHISLYDVT